MAADGSSSVRPSTAIPIASVLTRAIPIARRRRIRGRQSLEQAAGHASTATRTVLGSSGLTVETPRFVCLCARW